MVDSVTLYNRADCCSTRLNGVTVGISDTDSHADAEQCGTVPTASAVNVVPCKKKGQYVWVSLVKNHLTLCEVKVQASVPVDEEAKPLKMDHCFKKTSSSQRCSNYKVGGQWTRAWKKPGSLQACANMCMEDSQDCKSFSYAADKSTEKGSCLFTPAARGCVPEHWGNHYSLYKITGESKPEGTCTNTEADAVEPALYEEEEDITDEEMDSLMQEILPSLPANNEVREKEAESDEDKLSELAELDGWNA
jgi:hypothetical protein